MPHNRLRTLFLLIIQRSIKYFQNLALDSRRQFARILQPYFRILVLNVTTRWAYLLASFTTSKQNNTKSFDKIIIKDSLLVILRDFRSFS